MRGAWAPLALVMICGFGAETAASRAPVPPSAPGFAGPQRAYVALKSGSPIQDKDFYLLTLLQRLPALRTAVAKDPVLNAAGARRWSSLTAAKAGCNGEVACLVAAYLWSDDEIKATAEALAACIDRNGLMQTLVDRHMRPSGRFERYRDFDDRALLRQAWIDAAEGLNHIVRVYGLGEAPLYPLIDSISYPTGDKMWKESVEDQVDVALEAPPGPDDPFFQSALTAALDLLAMNDRDEPARLEPLALGENAQALAYARTIDWRAWTYPVLLIPGRSPTLRDNPLSPEAKMKLRLAARRFEAGVAPLIVTSGGYVSPAQTRFCEACEMKRELMRVYHIPERAILIDPFARHTTTNLRNTERLLFEAGAPLDRPILVLTTDGQSRYIEAPAFQARCRRELGYDCFSDFKRLSMFDTAVKLPLASLHRDARDPLDP